MPTVTFNPDGRTVDVAHGENLLRAALLADIVVHASCGGDGTCGKCLMVVEEGEVTALPSHRLSVEQAANGWVVGCQTTVHGDVTVRIPDESRPGSVPVAGGARRPVNPVLSQQERIARLPRHTSPPPVAKRLLRMMPPDGTDNVNDAARVKLALRRAHGIKDATISLPALRELPRVVREGDWTVTAIAAEPCDTMPGVSGFQPGDTTERQFAVAVDIGTTTVEVAVVDLNTGRIVARTADYNPQSRIGDDVISRILACDEGGRPAGAPRARRRMRERPHLTSARRRGRGRRGRRVVLRRGQHRDDAPVPRHHAGAHPCGALHTRDIDVPVDERAGGGAAGRPHDSTLRDALPASWLGGDIVAGVTAAGMPWTEKLTLFIDVGTNGEIVLGNSEWLVSASCSAGPAFEGGGILHGMRAADGAIEQVRIDDETLEPSFLTIGAAEAPGHLRQRADRLRVRAVLVRRARPQRPLRRAGVR